MRSVSRFESNLLRILQCFLGRIPLEHAFALIAKPLPRPNCLRRDAVELVKQNLSNGVVMLLTHGGGWTSQKYLRNDEVREGSLWQRTVPEQLGLEFSPASLDFLIWITEAAATEKSIRWVSDRRLNNVGSGGLTNGDQFLIYLAMRTLRSVEAVDHWYNHEPFRSNALLALALPEKFGIARYSPKPDFEPWMTGPGACVMEAMQDELAEAWVDVERNKGKVVSPKAMIRQGNAQETILNSFFDSVEKHSRRDLAKFLLQAAHDLLNENAGRDQWMVSLDTTDLRLADRTEAYRSASAFLRASKRLGKWHSESVGIGYFDEGYAESQLWKSLWESESGADALLHADRIVKELEF